MLGQKPRKKRNPFVDWLISVSTAILVLGALAGACFLFCTILFLLNQNAAS
jgi:hypothetical protein